MDEHEEDVAEEEVAEDNISPKVSVRCEGGRGLRESASAFGGLPPTFFTMVGTRYCMPVST